MSPAPMFLAMVTSSVDSMVYEESPSTSLGAMPASAKAATTASAANWDSGRSMDLANSVWPMPTMAAASCSTERLAELMSGDATARLAGVGSGWVEDDRQREGRPERHPLNVGRLGVGI